MVKLLIVESPAKAKTIQGYLGQGEWRVKASAGHVRDLPKHDLGVTPPNFQPTYEVNPDKSRIVTDLKKEVASASHVYLATDPDREGEAIAWHLKTVLRVKDPHRVTFDQVTPKAILAALQKPRKIHQPTVLAQEARRVADRLVGYLVSEQLRQKSGANLTAGRVQSPALRLVVDLEHQIRSFVVRDFFDVEIQLANGLRMALDVSRLAADGKHIFDRQIAEKAAVCKEVTIHSVVVEKKELAPPPAMNTSGLQQAANKALKLSAKKTMDLAQQLFEKGLISYHRTDNVNVAESTYEEICDWLKCNGFDYQRGQRRWKSKANAQEAHEAIRPVDFNVDTIEGDSALQGIYSLIRDRALMSQMPSAMVEQTRIVAVSGASVAGEGGELVPVQFRASGTRELSPGFRAFKPAVREETEDKDEQQLQCAVQEGEVHPVVQAQVRDKRTEPPKRFTEASLVKKLESLGIGRPATYASILGNVIGREYMVVGKDMKITATDTGITVVEALRQQAFLDYGFTSTLEDRLDHICEGKETYLEVVRGLYDTLQRDQERISVPRVGEGGAQASQASVACPECGLAVKRLPAKQRGEFFWVHVDTEHAEGCQKYLADVDGQPQKKGPKPPTPCPSCGKALKRLPSKQYAGQFFWVHQDAKNAEGCVKFLDDKKGRPVVKRPASSTEATCPRCGQPVIQKKNHQSGDPFWVHRDDPATCVKYLPDENGKPGIKSSRTTA